MEESPDRVMKVVCLVENPDVVSYVDVYEEGDEWVKIQGCEVCSLENRKKCCGPCPMFTDKGCYLHLDNMLNKPYRCVVKPTPRTCLTWCSLEFKCIKGKNVGKIKKVNSPIMA